MRHCCWNFTSFYINFCIKIFGSSTKQNLLQYHCTAAINSSTLITKLMKESIYNFILYIDEIVNEYIECLFLIMDTHLRLTYI